MAVTTGKSPWHFEDITTKSQTRKMIKRYQTKSTWIIFGLESSHLNLGLSINAQSCVILPKTRVFFRSFRDDSNWTRNSNMRPIILVLPGRRDFAVLLRRSDPLRHIRQKTSNNSIGVSGFGISRCKNGERNPQTDLRAGARSWTSRKCCGSGRGTQSRRTTEQTAKAGERAGVTEKRNNTEE